MLAAVTRADLDADLRWIDVVGISMLAGIGFTVALLIGDLAYGPGPNRDELVKVGVLCGSLLAAVLESLLLLTKTPPTGAFTVSRRPMTTTTGCPISTGLDRTDGDGRA